MVNRAIARQRSPLTLLGGFLGIVVLAAAIRWALSAPPVVRSEKYAMLFVWENNTHVLRATGPLVPVDPQVTFNPDTGGVFLTDGGIPRNMMGLVVHRVESQGQELQTRAFPVRSVPWKGWLKQPLDRRSSSYWKGVTGGGEIVENARLLSPNLEILELAEDGTALLVYDGREITLRPGQGWGQARYRSERGVAIIEDGPDWETRVAAELEGGSELTVLRIFNYGLWDKARISRGKEG